MTLGEMIALELNVRKKGVSLVARRLVMDTPIEQRGARLAASLSCL